MKIRQEVRRKLALLMSAVMILTAMPLTAMAAGWNLTVTPSKAEVPIKPGETVTVSFDIKAEEVASGANAQIVASDAEAAVASAYNASKFSVKFKSDKQTFKVGELTRSGKTLSVDVTAARDMNCRYTT